MRTLRQTRVLAPSGGPQKNELPRGNEDAAYLPASLIAPPPKE